MGQMLSLCLVPALQPSDWKLAEPRRKSSSRGRSRLHSHTNSRHTRQRRYQWSRMDRKPLRQFLLLQPIYGKIQDRGTSKTTLLSDSRQTLCRCGLVSKESDNPGWLERRKNHSFSGTSAHRNYCMGKSTGAWYAKQSLCSPCLWPDCCNHPRKNVPDYHPYR